MTDVLVSDRCGVIDSPARPFTHGYEVSLQNGPTLRFEHGRVPPTEVRRQIRLTILHNDGQSNDPNSPAAIRSTRSSPRSNCRACGRR